MQRGIWGVVLALAFVFVANDALAQRRGGSFGGSRFGSRSRSSSTGSRSTGSRSYGSRSTGSRSYGTTTPSYGSGTRSTPSGTTTTTPTYGGGSRGTTTTGSYGTRSRPRASRRGGGCGWGMGGGLCCLLIVVGGVGLLVVSRMRKGASGGATGGTYAGPDAMHVHRLSLGIDWRARREVQGTLQRLAETGDTTSEQGLAHLLRETVLALRRAELSWLYVSQESHGPMSPQDAEQRFQQSATSARAAYQTELVRGAGGEVHTQDAPEMRANPNEGEGTVVVHLIVAAERPLQGLQAPDADQIRAALDNRAAVTAQQLVALEVVWSPADENDRMSTAELEQFYPDMRLIDPNSIAGRLFCTYCKGPFAMELLQCPHCGAPAEASQDNRTPPGA
ncbi:MAG: DUF1517 domain-containing protein [Myxococcota bacterium]|nr:DUF1517 domain-containing protein [Myxococcota bacterium]